jgi:hypothetical protein
MNVAKKILFIVHLMVSIIAILSLSGCTAMVLRSTISSKPVVIDGNLDEWNPAQFTMVEDNKTSFAATNDSLFLYIAGRCSDPTKIRSIEREGITIWIDPSCDQKTNFELHYPASLYAPLNQHRGGFWDALSAEQQGRALARLKELQDGILIIDKGTNNADIIRHDSTGYISAAYNFTKPALTFEIRIPLGLTKYFPKIASLLQQEKIEIGFGRSRYVPGEYPDVEYGRSRTSGGAMGTGQPGVLPARDARSNDTDIWFELIFAKP